MIIQDAHIVYIISVNRPVFVTYSCVFSVSLKARYLIFVLRSSIFEGSHAERGDRSKEKRPEMVEKLLISCAANRAGVTMLFSLLSLCRKWFVVLSCTVFVCPTITFQARHCTADRAIVPYRAYHNGLYTYHQLFHYVSPSFCLHTLRLL